MQRLPMLLLATAPAVAQQVVRLDSSLVNHWSAFDAERRRLVLFGIDGDTFEYDGGVLMRRASAASTGPVARLQPVLVHDPVRHHLLMFGGRFGSALADTWTWDGLRWSQRVGAAPPARFAAAATFDSARGRIVLFGGQNGTVLQDTWEHDGSAWIARAVGTPTSAPNAPVLAFDSTRAVTVMTLSQGIIGQPVAVWEYDGVAWTQRSSGANAPVTGNGSTMTFDPVRGRCVYVGGGTNTSGPAPGATIHEWDGAQWTSSPSPVVLGRFCSAWFDAVTGTVEVAGMVDASTSSTSPFGQWSWDGTSLQLRSSRPQTGSRVSSAWMSAPGGGALSFGGGVGLNLLNDTRLWDGLRWNELQAATVPPARSTPAVAFDLVGNRGLMFGGYQGAQRLNDLWAWDGRDWTQLGAAANAPPGRGGAGLVVDLLRLEVVLFGGAGQVANAQTSAYRNDTWIWNGVAWSQRATPAALLPRETPALTYDPLRGVAVLFGGRDGATAQDQFDDTWEWNGAQWSRRTTPTTPPALLMQSLVFDPFRTRVRLTGTQIVTGSTSFFEHLWEYDGVDWTQIASRDTGYGQGTVAAVDRARGTIVMYDGSSVREWTDWPAAVAHTGTGCGAPVPTVTTRTRPRLGDPDFGIELRTAPQLPALVAVATAGGSASIGNGCTLLLSGPTFASFVVADATGTATLPWRLPASTRFRGAVAFAQAVVLDPRQPGGFAASDALRITFGD